MVTASLLSIMLFGLLSIFQACSQENDRQNVILITIDTLRADHLGCYGYPRETSPAIDAFAQKSVVFTECVSQATSTLSSHASIFTSLHPPTHGVIHNLAGLSEDVPSLVRVFRKHGYSTGAIISNIVLESRFGLNQGFQTYDEKLDSRELNREKFLERRADATTDTSIDWLNGRNNEKFFLWIHYIDPHGAYYPPKKYRELFVGDEKGRSETQEFPISTENFARNAIPKYQELFGIKDASYYISQYDGEIRFTDDQIARLLQYLEQSQLISKTIVVITADHGETLIERDYLFSHTYRTYDELAIIPLIIYFPDLGLHRRIDEQVRSIDIMPTLLDKLKLKNPYPIHGHSLMPLILNEEKQRSRFAVVYSDHGIDVLDKVIGAQTSIRTSSWKLTRNSWNGSEELYNLDNDPLEKNNLAKREPEVLGNMQKLLDEWERVIDRTTVREPDIPQERIDQLNSLGYIMK